MNNIIASINCGVGYLEMPKVACSSIKAALLEADGFDQLTGDGMHEHRHFNEIPHSFKPRFIFTFVRHPIDRLASSYWEKLRSGKAERLQGNCRLPTGASPLDWIRWVAAQDPQRCDRHWRPQSVWIDQSRAKLDLIGRYESIHQQWKRLRIEFDLPPLPMLNVSSRPPWQDLFRGEALALATEFYNCDLKGFDHVRPR